MDDCNSGQAGIFSTGDKVQIPLWTIVTSKLGEAYSPKLTGSDSSMDDCNALRSSVPTSFGTTVQIPLWTIVTTLKNSKRKVVQSSDSSMDDCNPVVLQNLQLKIVFRFLYGRL